MDVQDTGIGLESLAVGVSLCDPSFVTYPTGLTGVQFVSHEASLVTNFTDAFFPSAPSLNFCNISITHTHPGQGDRIQTEVWLPVGDSDDSPSWNGRLQGVGGGGFLAGFWPGNQAAAVAEGYAAVTTDGGHQSRDPGDPSSWALLSEGNVDIYAFENFASRALHESAIIGRALTEAFYGQKVQYAYFTGCSTGGRQAAMLAQRWPDTYDGYLSGAPGLRFEELLVASLWPQVRMRELDYAPPPCELDQFTLIATRECDLLDGSEDGIVADPALCRSHFKAAAHVGTEFTCEQSGTKMQLTSAGAQIAEAVWNGWWENGKEIWHGVGLDAPLTNAFGLAATSCDYEVKPIRCTPVPWALAVQWVNNFVLKSHNVTADYFSTMTRQDLKQLLRQSRQRYHDMISTTDANLSELRNRGTAKLLMWHGTSDECIPLQNTRDYYDAVAAHDPEGVDEYFRYFEAPGVTHCGMAPSAHALQPNQALHELRRWVEEGKAPDVMSARTESHPDTGIVTERLLCRYPQRQVYGGSSDVTKADSFHCE